MQLLLVLRHCEIETACGGYQAGHGGNKGPEDDASLPNDVVQFDERKRLNISIQYFLSI